MNKLNCEYILDIYPDILNGTAAAELTQQVRAHVASCDECRRDIMLLENIYSATVTVPAGLQERVTNAALLPQPRRRFARSDIAMVATLAAAMIGGSLLLEREPRATVNTTNQGFGFVSVEDAMLSGTSSLDDLSIEELEKLLGEIES